MKNALLAIAFAYLVGCSTAPTTVTPTADKLDLKDGATLDHIRMAPVGWSTYMVKRSKCVTASKCSSPMAG